MAKFKYNGQAPCRHGSGLVKPGAIIEMAAAPNKNWEPVETVAQRSRRHPTRQEDVTRQEDTDES